MFEFGKHIVIPNKDEVHEYATGWVNDEEGHQRRVQNPNQLLKNVWVYIEVLDLPREVKACSLMEIAISLITIITLEKIEKMKVKKGKA
jgi:hypothetical protein